MTGESFGEEFSRYRAAVRSALEAQGASRFLIDKVLAATTPVSGMGIRRTVDVSSVHGPDDPSWPHTSDALSNTPHVGPELNESTLSDNDTKNSTNTQLGNM